MPLALKMWPQEKGQWENSSDLEDQNQLMEELKLPPQGQPWSSCHILIMGSFACFRMACCTCHYDVPLGHRDLLEFESTYWIRVLTLEVSDLSCTLCCHSCLLQVAKSLIFPHFQRQAATFTECLISAITICGEETMAMACPYAGVEEG